jgi:hypothetical protein
MSMILCEHCDGLIDSDDDPGCFCDNPYDSRDTRIVCENCREIAYDRQQEDLMQNGGGPSLIEQQIAAMKFK